MQPVGTIYTGRTPQESRTEVTEATGTEERPSRQEVRVPLPKPPPASLPTQLRQTLRQPPPTLPRCALCGMTHIGVCLWNNTPRPPQEAPPDSDSSSYTYSDEYYEFTSDEEQQGTDAVEHGPWVPREALPANMQPQDGAFHETPEIAEQLPIHRPREPH